MKFIQLNFYTTVSDTRIYKYWWELRNEEKTKENQNQFGFLRTVNNFIRIG